MSDPPLGSCYTSAMERTARILSTVRHILAPGIYVLAIFDGFMLLVQMRDAHDALVYWHVSPQLFFALLYLVVVLIVVNWVTNFIAGINKPTLLHHIWQSIVWYGIAILSFGILVASADKDYADEAGKFLGFALAALIVIGGNALYLFVKRLRWNMHNRSKVLQS